MTSTPFFFRFLLYFFFFSFFFLRILRILKIDNQFIEIICFSLSTGINVCTSHHIISTGEIIIPIHLPLYSRIKVSQIKHQPGEWIRKMKWKLIVDVDLTRTQTKSSILMVEKCDIISSHAAKSLHQRLSFPLCTSDCFKMFVRLGFGCCSRVKKELCGS